MDGTIAKDPHLGDNTPGILIAKTSSPVNLDVESTAQSLGKFNKSTNSLKAALTKAPAKKVSLKRSISSVTNSDSNISSSKKPTSEKAKNQVQHQQYYQSQQRPRHQKKLLAIVTILPEKKTPRTRLHQP